ncbi:MAG: HNH endonuclease [Chloroflexi bacterium]|nr:HNH endonuclease [Chloroflexota bacterium]
MAAILEQVRQRANFACEYCGVTEEDSGGKLTIDHFQPRSKNGSDSLENLLYCCIRCNQYKQNYWPENPDQPSLWNPRQEPAFQHFLQLDNGTLYPLTSTGAFTLKRLRLNRSFLVAHRLKKQQREKELRLLMRYQELVKVLAQLQMQLSDLIEEQQTLLKEQQELLILLLNRKN